MTRLIDADALDEAMYHKSFEVYDGRTMWNSGCWIRYKIYEEASREAPTVEAVPVRHGKWIDTETFNRPWFRHHIFKCSVCGNTLDMDGVNAGRGDANYCPNCGSKMDGEHEID